MPSTLAAVVSSQGPTMHQSTPPSVSSPTLSSSPSPSVSSLPSSTPSSPISPISLGRSNISHSKNRSISSFESHQSDDENSIETRPSLHQILLNQGRGRYTLDNFAAFLHSQFCYENLAFWLAARQYKLCAQSLYQSVTQSTPQFNLHIDTTPHLSPSQSRQFTDLQRKMRTILDTFVLPSSPHELNLSDAVRCRLLRGVAEGNFHPNVLEQAREAIMDLMKCSSYPMFLEDVAHKRNSGSMIVGSPRSQSSFDRSSNESENNTNISWRFKAKYHLKLVSKMLKRNNN